MCVVRLQQGGGEVAVQLEGGEVACALELIGGVQRTAGT